MNTKGHFVWPKPEIVGFVLVAIAASLWATDAIFRQSIVGRMPPLLVVFYEHLIALGPLSFFALQKHGLTDLLKMSRKEWISAFIIGGGGSAAATVFFTSSFQYINPSVAILLQKLQPVFSISLAVIILGERLRMSFVILAIVALLSSLVLSFPDLDLSFLSDPSAGDQRWIGILSAVAAAILWASSLIAGKFLTQTKSPAHTSAWRFIFGTTTLGMWIGLEGIPFSTPALSQSETWTALIYMGLISGVLAMGLYYSGLQKTSAVSATFAELFFPVSAIFINAIFLGQSLSSIQLLASIVLLASVTMISLERRACGEGISS